MKQLIMTAAAALCLTGCASYEGRPGEDSYVETENDRRVQSRVADNLQDVSRHGSPMGPLRGNNGSLNF